MNQSLSDAAINCEANKKKEIQKQILERGKQTMGKLEKLTRIKK